MWQDSVQDFDVALDKGHILKRCNNKLDDAPRETESNTRKEPPPGSNAAPINQPTPLFSEGGLHLQRDKKNYTPPH